MALRLISHLYIKSLFSTITTMAFSWASVVIIGLVLSGCATPPEDQIELDLFERNNDPFEPTNRAIFTFNQKVDIVLFRPLANAYRAVPIEGRNRIKNLANHANLPVHLVNALLQGDMEQVGNTLGRFLINSTVGIAGAFDAASAIGIEDVDADFASTLAFYGFPDGPYIVVPIIGPSNPRLLVGQVANSYVDPLNWLYSNANMNPEAPLIQGSVSGIDLYSRVIDNIIQIEERSIDYYAALRSHFQQTIRHNEDQYDPYDNFSPFLFTPIDKDDTQQSPNASP